MTETKTLRPKVIIFDFDGTIADSLEAFVAIAQKISGTNTKIRAEELRSLRGLIKFGQRIHAPYWRFPLALRQVRGMVDRRIDEIPPFAGMEAALAQLYAEGYQLFIASTNATGSIDKFLNLHHLSRYFSGVYGSGALVTNKTKSLRILLRRQKLTADDCVLIGDEDRDIAAAEAVGMRCIAVAWGFTEATDLERLAPAAVVKAPEDLATTIKSLS